MKNKIKRLCDVAYYCIKDAMEPNNVVVVRNTDKSWNDRDHRLLHCVFSVLCDFVELEQGGSKEYEKTIKETFEYSKDEKNHCQEMCKLQAEDDQKILDLYVWYNSINWKDPNPYDFSDVNNPEKCRQQLDKEEVFYNLCTEKAKQVLDLRHRLWT